MENILIANQGFRDLNPLICGEQRCHPGHSFGPASRTYYLLHYVLSGKGTYYCGGREYALGKGQFFVIRPYVMTLYRADREDPWHYCWIGFEAGMDLDGLLDRDVFDLPGAEYIFQGIRQCKSVRASKELYLCARLFELLALLNEAEEPPEGPVPHYILKARNYIESNYMEEISVGKLAEYLNLDRSYFSTAFRRSTGKSPQQYIVDFRLRKAAELLAVHGYRPGEAGQSVGYPDIFHFSRMFKRKFGLSPTEYAARKRP